MGAKHKGLEGSSSSMNKRLQDVHYAGFNVIVRWSRKVLWRTGPSSDAALMFSPEIIGATAAPRVGSFLRERRHTYIYTHWICTANVLCSKSFKFQRFVRRIDCTGRIASCFRSSVAKDRGSG